MQEPFQRITVQQAKEMFDRGTAQLIDVREKKEWDQGHIKGAVLIPVNDVLARIKEVAADRDVIFHCAVGVRSALACEMAAAMGRGHLYNMEGGMEAWQALHYPVEK
jgi:rhodanese-related sulfurtransferase